LNNLHITLTDFSHETRILKQTRSIIRYGIAQKVYIASLHSGNLRKKEYFESNIILNRFKLLSRSMPKLICLQVFKYIELIIVLLMKYRGKNIRIINIHSLSLLPIGVILKHIFKSQLVYDTHELETETIFLSGFRKRVSKCIERKLICFCDIIFVVSESISNWYAIHYEIEKPWVVLNTPNYEDICSNESLRYDLDISSDKIVFLYQGGLFPGRGIEALLSVFKSIGNINAVIVFMGYGPLKSIIEKNSEEHENIFFQNAVHPDEVLKYTASADFGLSIIENRCLSYYYCMPNKIFEYTMAGVPIIVSNLPEMTSFVDKNQVGVVIKNESPDSIIEGINRILQRDRNQLSLNARKSSKRYCWEVEEKKMIYAYNLFLHSNS
jgi:glycosyltransferase involved in cell wall biosynthesis